MDIRITTVLNVFKRKKYLKKQIEYIENQSIPSDVWLDITLSNRLPIFPLKKYPSNFHTNQNLFHFGRLFYALNAQTEFVFICDDDIFPGERYFESCINYLNKNPRSAIISYGQLLKPVNSYEPSSNFGWHSIRKKQQFYDPVFVDMGGHSWFIRTEFFRKCFNQSPISFENGEDLFLSYQLFNIGVKLVVLPHVFEQPEFWSSNPKLSWKVGTDSNATYKRDSHKIIRDKIVKTYREMGWVFLSE